QNKGLEELEIIRESISEDKGESLLDPANLKKYLRSEQISDGQGYELWLITTKINTEGQSVTLERPILKFDVSGGEPIPAVEELPMEFPELKLEAVPLNGNDAPPAVENGEMEDIDVPLPEA